MFSDVFAFARAALSACFRHFRHIVTQPQPFTLVVPTGSMTFEETVCVVRLKVEFHPTRGLSVSACTILSMCSLSVCCVYSQMRHAFLSPWASGTWILLRVLFLYIYKKHFRAHFCETSLVLLVRFFCSTWYNAFWTTYKSEWVLAFFISTSYCVVFLVGWIFEGT